MLALCWKDKRKPCNVRNELYADRFCCQSVVLASESIELFFIKSCKRNPLLCFLQQNNENHGQWKRYQRHIANVSITPVIIISALQKSCYRNVCNMLLISSSLAVIFIIRLFSTSAFLVCLQQNLQGSFCFDICSMLLVFCGKKARPWRKRRQALRSQPRKKRTLVILYE